MKALWNNYKANAINNELILSQSPISISWYDVVLNLIPIIGDIADGIINTVQYNKSY